MRFKKQSVPLYGIDLVFTISETEKEVTDKLEIELPENTFCYTQLTTLRKKGFEIPTILISIVEGTTNGKITTGAIAHESFHAASFVYEYLQTPIKNDEPFAYLLDWITDQLYIFIHESKQHL